MRRLILKTLTLQKVALIQHWQVARHHLQRLRRRLSRLPLGRCQESLQSSQQVPQLDGRETVAIRLKPRDGQFGVGTTVANEFQQAQRVWSLQRLWGGRLPTRQRRWFR